MRSSVTQNKAELEYAFFLGCTAPLREQNYEISTRKIAGRLGIDLVDLEFTCCGFPVEALSQEATLLMTARNLALAEERGLNIVTICNTCTKTLTKGNGLLRKNPGLLDSVNKRLKNIGGYEYKGNVNVKHLVRVLYEDVGIEKVRERVSHPLTRLTVATHYGCHYSRPSEVYDNFDDPEKPKILDNLVEATGSKLVHYDNEKMCCGGPLLATSSPTALSLGDEKLNAVKMAGADALIVICPFCGLMYDLCQREIEEKFNRRYHLPILYFTQLLGLSMNINQSELGLELNRVDVGTLLKKIV